MAAIAQTAANVRHVSGDRGSATAGEALTAGNPIYLDAADSDKAKKTDTDTLAQSVCVGIALHDAANGQPVLYAKPGSVVNLGATLTVGEIYLPGPTAGQIVPVADQASADYVTILGVSLTAANLYLMCYNSQIAKA